MELTQATPALEFKKALVAATTAMMADQLATQDVLVCFGLPGTFTPEDIIAFGRISSDQETATMSSNRSREEVITLEVTISCFRGGGEESELVAAERCYELLRMIERYARMTDTTIGGTVRECFLTSHTSDGATPGDVASAGRVIEVTATFTARVRVRA
ncbi:hypothetical protein MB46_10385 [Arthrobacter alpinus]|uniref:hypothetical protein n=1 Tax=Arthrobacter alpinus TaxID=656366 RepID=UPI0005C95CDB|nr:hypothetical protein [Arthrobacter alpinus]ALV45828.1 hypothetical protein MB46_10385 [Arthrobacter alpinus]